MKLKNKDIMTLICKLFFFVLLVVILLNAYSMNKKNYNIEKFSNNISLKNEIDEIITYISNEIELDDNTLNNMRDRMSKNNFETIYNDLLFDESSEDISNFKKLIRILEKYFSVEFDNLDIDTMTTDIYYKLNNLEGFENGNNNIIDDVLNEYEYEYEYEYDNEDDDKSIKYYKKQIKYLLSKYMNENVVGTDYSTSDVKDTLNTYLKYNLNEYINNNYNYFNDLGLINKIETYYNYIITLLSSLPDIDELMKNTSESVDVYNSNFCNNEYENYVEDVLEYEYEYEDETEVIDNNSGTNNEYKNVIDNETDDSTNDNNNTESNDIINDNTTESNDKGTYSNEYEYEKKGFSFNFPNFNNMFKPPHLKKPRLAKGEELPQTNNNEIEYENNNNNNEIKYENNDEMEYENSCQDRYVKNIDYSNQNLYEKVFGSKFHPNFNNYIDKCVVEDIDKLPKKQKTCMNESNYYVLNPNDRFKCENTIPYVPDPNKVNCQMNDLANLDLGNLYNKCGVKPGIEVYNQYGYSYMPPQSWTMPQERPARCSGPFIPNPQAVYTEGAPVDSLEWNKLLPKFKYTELEDEYQYKPGIYYTSKVQDCENTYNNNKVIPKFPNPLKKKGMP
mgnify:CR=1 FL=1